MDFCGAIFERLASAIPDPTARWNCVSLDLEVIPESSLDLHSLRMLVASSGMAIRNSTLRLRSSSAIPEPCSNAVLPEGGLDLRSTQLSSFWVRMAYADMFRVRTSWHGLKSLTFGSPHTGHRFLPWEALNILRSAPNLIHCTIHFLHPRLSRNSASGLPDPCTPGITYDHWRRAAPCLRRGAPSSSHRPFIDRRNHGRCARCTQQPRVPMDRKIRKGVEGGGHRSILAHENHPQSRAEEPAERRATQASLKPKGLSNAPH
ncbi:hypothetical protein FA13DRAFT_876704 [Coprinellus micaceus]|uniref:Uncharacterized protein n=1 Tax=Coprinellus micaceus TaxID=71717 RepID=A0A4Y7T0F2_COPMI|nr:hypothetical protein FA13DRAFT_876704 [Coprinellus micaceus]